MIVSRLDRVSSITESSDALYAVACPSLRRAELLALACVGGVQLPNHILKALSHLPTLSEKHVIRRIDRVLRPTCCGISLSIPTSHCTDLQISCLSRRPAPAANAESNGELTNCPCAGPPFTQILAPCTHCLDPTPLVKLIPSKILFPPCGHLLHTHSTWNLAAHTPP